MKMKRNKALLQKNRYISYWLFLNSFQKLLPKSVKKSDGGASKSEGNSKAKGGKPPQKGGKPLLKGKGGKKYITSETSDVRT